MKHLRRLVWGLMLALTWTPIVAAEPALAGLPALNVAALAASDQQLFVGGFDAGLFVVNRDGSVRRVLHPALNQHINALTWSERERALWVGTARGLARCELHDVVSCRRIGASEAVRALVLRRDGSLIAGGDAGLAIVEGEVARRQGKKDGAPFRAVWSLAEADDGTLFIGTTNGLFWGQALEERAGFQRASLVTGELPDDWVTALRHGGDELHVGTYNAGVVSFRVVAGELVRVRAERSAGYVNPAGIAITRSKRLALLTMDGLRVGPSGATRPFGPLQDVTALLPAWAGGYWLGTRQGVVWVDLFDG